MYTLIVLAVATLVSEDLTCIAAGVLVSQLRITLAAGSTACFAGIFVGDLLLYLAGHLLGPSLLRLRFMRRIVSPVEVERAAEWLDRRGFVAIFTSRFTPGTRLPLYLGAGIVRAGFMRFVVYTAVACALWAPMLVGLTAWVGRDNVEAALWTSGRAALVSLSAIALIRMLTWERRRGLLGFFLRKTRWEFWPVWAAYLPLVPWLVYLAIRYRSLTVFSAANPGIFSSGLAGESKAAILQGLDPSGSVAQWTSVPYTLITDRTQRIREFMNARGLTFPIVLKPDVGERGTGVSIVRDRDALKSYLNSSREDLIAQEYIPGLEFGVFYCRKPDEPHGRIISITEKRFPEVIGDGVATLKHLILADRRAVCISSVYLRAHANAATRIPAAGERVRLAELGSHCRGAAFFDATYLCTESLERRADEISKTHPGFFFGRYDIRTASVDDLRAGRFTVIELNGVAAEPTHIYDPHVSLASAYAALFHHWRLAFEIGAANRSAGAEPMRMKDLISIARARLNGRADVVDLNTAAAQLQFSREPRLHHRV